MKIHASVKGLVREIRRGDLSAVEHMGFLEMTATVVPPAHLLNGNKIQKNLKNFSKGQIIPQMEMKPSTEIRGNRGCFGYFAKSGFIHILFH